MLDVTLEVPLPPFAFGGLLQGDDAGAARIEVLGEAFDGAALAGGVAALEEDDDPLAVSLTQYCSFSSSICCSRLCRSYSGRLIRAG
jgi:hypothetical protein